MTSPRLKRTRMNQEAASGPFVSASRRPGLRPHSRFRVVEMRKRAFDPVRPRWRIRRLCRDRPRDPCDDCHTPAPGPRRRSFDQSRRTPCPARTRRTRRRARRQRPGRSGSAFGCDTPYHRRSLPDDWPIVNVGHARSVDLLMVAADGGLEDRRGVADIGTLPMSAATIAPVSIVDWHARLLLRQMRCGHGNSSS